LLANTVGQLIPFLIVLLSLTVHEAAHAWTADRLGDPTARRLGRLSLNPIVHIDLFGTILLPLLAIVSNLPVIGWAKPVPVDGANLRHYRRDFMVIAAAGPASNIALAVLASIAVRIVGALHEPVPGGGLNNLFLPQMALLLAMQINVLLAVFNMIPIPPLDGGNVLAGLLPESLADVFDKVRPFGFVALYALLLTGALSQLIWPPAMFLLELLLP
jgi:Zn-dependent protease